jgi:hypothetical protein
MWPLRPSNLSVPSSRPTQRGGGTCPVRQGVPGAGEGQHTSREHDACRKYWSRSRGPIQGPGSKDNGLGAPGRSQTPPVHHGRARFCGCSHHSPVRRGARPLPSVTRVSIVAYRMPPCVYAWNRRHAPTSGPGPSVRSLGRGFFPVVCAICGRLDCRGGRIQRLRQKPTFSRHCRVSSPQCRSVGQRIPGHR